jgi:hypothetical protein
LTTIKRFSKNPKIVCLVFLTFFICLMLQHWQVFYYFDDFGYASLSYRYTEPNASAMNYNLSQIFDYLGHHYQIWGGRVVSFFQCIVLMRGGLPLIRTVQSIVITLIFACIYKISQTDGETKRTFFLALMVCALYGTLSISVQAVGTYWFSASVLYIFPFFYLLVGMLCYKKALFQYRGKAEWKNYFLAMFLLFLAAFSMEQSGFAAIVTVVAFSACALWKKKDKSLLKKIIPMVLVTVTGFIILIIAPGNAIRKAHPFYADYYNLPFLNQIKVSFTRVFYYTYSDKTKLFCIVFSLAALGMAFANEVHIQFQKEGKLRNFSWVVNPLTIGLSLFYIFRVSFMTEGAFISNSQFLDSCLGFLYTICIFWSVTQYLFQKNTHTDLFIWCIFLGGYGSMAVLMVVPEFTYRNLLFFSYATFLLVARVICDAFRWLERKDWKFNQLAILLFCPLLICSAVNLVDIYLGYRTNGKVLKYDERVMKQVQEKRKNGQDIQTVKIFKIPLSDYGIDTAVPNEWTRQYYGLPKEFYFQFVDYDANEFKQAVSDLENSNG